jgi:hypothetical protein
MLIPLVAFNDDSEQYRPVEPNPAPRDRRRLHQGPGGLALGGPRGRGDHRGLLDPRNLPSGCARRKPALDRHCPLPERRAA